MAAPAEADVMAKFQEIFNLMDDDGSKSITVEELGQILRANGNQLDDAAVNDIIKKVDDNGDGSIDVDEFKALLADPSVKDAAKLAVVFLSLDNDGDRTVSSDELSGAQGVLDADKLTALKTSADSSPKKELTFKEFLEVMASK